MNGQGQLINSIENGCGDKNIIYSINKMEGQGQQLEKMKFGKLKKLVEVYNQIPKRQIKKRREVEWKVYDYLCKKVDYDSVAYNHVFLYIFHNVKGAEELYNNQKARIDKQHQEALDFEANLKEITKELKVGDVILDNEEYNKWVVIEVGKNRTIIKKQNWVCLAK